MDYFFSSTYFLQLQRKTQVTHYSSASLYFLIYMAQDYVLDRESWSSCYHSILLSVSMHVFALLLPLTG